MGRTDYILEIVYPKTFDNLYSYVNNMRDNLPIDGYEVGKT